MPIYEYLCEKCSHEFEKEQRITDDPVKTCPKCRSRRVKKLISQTSFVLKGGGWYSDLYSSSKKDGKDGKKSADSAESSGAGGSSKSDKDSSESKPAKSQSSGSSDKSAKSGAKTKAKKDAA